MIPRGGTELLFNNFLKYVGEDWYNKINLLLSVCKPEYIDKKRINLVWQHLSYDQYNVIGMTDPNFYNNIQHFVYVSNWQKNQFIEKFNVGHLNNHVLLNAIEPIDYTPKPTDKIKLIYISTPDRGLEVLLDSLDILNRKDIEVIIYSSTIIYGKQYSDTMRGKYEVLFSRCKSNPIIKYMGYGLNQAVRKQLQRSHILAYPSIFEETSCLSAIEAAAAGCKIVTTDYGALSETCGKYASYIPYNKDYKKLAIDYAELLNYEIDNYKIDSEDLKSQSSHFNNKYSWLNRAYDWKELFKKICAK